MKKILNTMFTLMLSGVIVIFVGCKFSGSYSGILGDIEISGELDQGSGEPADDSGTSLGSGEIEMDNGDTFTGEFFDTDGDGNPDKFKPDAGQTGSEMAGETNGTDWFNIDLDDVKQPPSQPRSINRIQN